MNLTTVLDLVGALLVIAGIAVFVSTFTVAGGLAAGGLGVLVLSWLIDRQATARGKEKQ